MHFKIIFSLYLFTSNSKKWLKFILPAIFIITSPNKKAWKLFSVYIFTNSIDRFCLTVRVNLLKSLRFDLCSLPQLLLWQCPNGCSGLSYNFLPIVPHSDPVSRCPVCLSRQHVQRLIATWTWTRVDDDDDDDDGAAGSVKGYELSNVIRNEF